MRVFLFISKQGDSLPIAQRIEKEGHRVLFYINDEKSRRVGDGLIEKHKETRVLVGRRGGVDKQVLNDLLTPTPDCIVFDMVSLGFGRVADSYRKLGYPVIGGGEWNDRIELDRPFGSQVMDTVGIEHPPTYTFKDYPSAIEFVKSSGDTYVYKPSGNQPTTTTYVSRGPEDMIGILEYYSSEIKEEFMLQKKVNGVEVSTEIWFNGRDVVHVNHTMEEKSLLEGGKGPKTGCMGSVVWVGDLKSKLYKETLKKLIPLLRKVKYIGPLDINGIVDGEHFWGLEFTSRFGYDAIFVLLEMYKDYVNDLLYETATGLLKSMKFKSKLGIGVDISVPPYPLIDCPPDLYKDILIQGLNKYNLKHFWGYDIYKKDGRYLVSGNGGDIGTVTARGDEIRGYSPYRDAKRRVMRTISNIIVPDMMYREDIGSRYESDKKKLRDWGWIT